MTLFKHRTNGEGWYRALKRLMVRALQIHHGDV
jgi:hypothetical protein